MVEKLSMRHLLALREIARTKSFTQAATRLNTTQSNLSLAVREAETILGTRLFNRTTKRFALTSLGEEFLPVVERVLADLQRGIENLEANVQLQRGVLSLGTAPLLAATFLPPLLAKYRATYPHIELKIEDSTTAEHTRLLRAGQIELGIGTYAEGHSDLALHHLAKFPLVLAMHRSLASRKRFRWKDIAPESMVSIERGSSVGNLIEATLWQVQKRPHEPALTCHNFSTVLALTTALRSSCIVPAHAVSPESYPELISVPLSEPTVSRTLSVAYRKDASLSPPARAFVDQLLGDPDLQASA